MLEKEAVNVTMLREAVERVANEASFRERAQSMHGSHAKLAAICVWRTLLCSLPKSMRDPLRSTQRLSNETRRGKGHDN